MYKTIEIPLKPNLLQVVELNKLLKLNCDFYNHIVNFADRYYSEYNKSISKNNLFKVAKYFKLQNKEYDYVHSHLLQCLVTRYCLARAEAFRKFKVLKKTNKKLKLELPKTKKLYKFKTLWFKQLRNGHKFVDDYKIKFNHLKIKYLKGIPIYGIPKYFGITKRVNRFYLLICVETNDVPDINKSNNILNNYKSIKHKSKTTKREVGVDLGVKTYLYLSDGTYYDNPKLINKHKEKIEKAQVNLDRKIKDSNNYKKQRRLLAKHHQKLRNIRKDLVHKISKDLVRNYDFIVFEDLSIINMMKDNYPVLNKHIANCAWNRLVLYTEYKANMYNKTVVLIDPKKTTQICSSCLEEVPKLFEDREHKCPNCGLEIDRDLNASRNILRLGLEARNGPLSETRQEALAS